MKSLNLKSLITNQLNINWKNIINMNPSQFVFENDKYCEDEDKTCFLFV